MGSYSDWEQRQLDETPPEKLRVGTEGPRIERPKQPVEAHVFFHGVEYPQYFQGFGLKEGMTDVATGFGESEKYALEDALESLAQNGWDTGAIESMLHDYHFSKEVPRKVLEADEDGDGPWVYISVDVR